MEWLIVKSVAQPHRNDLVQELTTPNPGTRVLCRLGEGSMQLASNQRATLTVQAQPCHILNASHDLAHGCLALLETIKLDSEILQRLQAPCDMRGMDGQAVNPGAQKLALHYVMHGSVGRNRGTRFLSGLKRLKCRGPSNAATSEETYTNASAPRSAQAGKKMISAASSGLMSPIFWALCSSAG